MTVSHIERIRNSEHFDADWYLQAYPDVSILGMDPAEHYTLIGWRLNRLPSKHFKLSAVQNGGSLPHENPLLGDDQHAASAPLANVNAKTKDSSHQAPPMAAPKVDPLIRETSSAARSGRDKGTPHYGAPLQRLVEAAEARLAPEGTSAEYDVIRRYFDVAYYLMRYPDIAQAKKLDVVQHYMQNGAKEGRDPSPIFSTRHYMRRYPDVAASKVNPFYHWLTVGRSEGRVAAPFDHFEEMSGILGHSARDVEDELIKKRQDLRERFEHGVLGEMVNKAAEIEPLIAQCWREALSVKLPPFHSDHVVSQTVAMHNMQHDAGFQRAKTVVVIPHCRLSGATRIAGYLATALAELQGASEVVVISSDLDIMMFPDWFPENFRHVSLAKHAHGLPRALQEKLLVEFIRSLGATQVFNVNSSLFWDAFKSFGKALSVTTDVYAYFFCNDKDSLGHWVGYPLQKFYRHFDMLSGVITDSHVLAEELSARYIVPETQRHKLVTLETPVPEIPPIAPTPVRKAKNRPTFFWSGRFDRQKRVDLAFAIARKMPDCDFRFWGEPVLDRQDRLGDVPGNVSMQGTYASLDELPFQECDAWLYTSEWDGVPNILIEIAARAVPLVGSIAGGTGEILKPDMSWPVDGIEDVDAYVAGLWAVISDQDDARAKALRLRQDVLSRRTSDIYRSSLATYLGGSRRIGDAS